MLVDTSLYLGMVKVKLLSKKGKQLELFSDASFYADSDRNDLKSLSLTQSVSDRKSQALQRFLTHKNVNNSSIAHINTYSPGRRKAKYYRLSFRQGNRTKHIHIPGGNVTVKLVQDRASELSAMINRGAKPQELKATIEGWKSGN